MNSFAIVVFSKNEEENIPSVIDQLFKFYTTEDIVFVIDGSIEPTAQILSERQVRFIKGPNKGKGAAIRTAIEAIEKDILVFMDADGSHDAGEVESLVEPLRRNEAEMVIGSRFLGHSDELNGSLSNCIRLLGNHLGNLTINLLWNRSGRSISDAQNGFRSIKRESFLTLGLTENNFAIEQEMVIKCLKKGYRISEVSSWEKKRQKGRSHISGWHLIDYVGCFFKHIFREKERLEDSFKR